ncbi:LysM peptidoglycan-binding domain-containing protein [Salinicoccus halitifaciens]|uniref:LysM peptidoglycan-binding domain-containing protein n=1 Tax=Salinicoccus halitifaciens TaxID=1073415 RepID=UPI002E7C114F|nr:LysM peptidoglycan-binding domain-containing protein [Salinicoccus halitifaciens]
MKKLLSVGTAVAVSSIIAANAEASEKGHEVQSGDTLSEIAAANSTTVSALKAANDLSSDLIFPGQVLQVAEVAEEKAETEAGVYVIQPGDTLFEIAVEFDLTVKELMDLNNLTSDLIFPGNELIVSKDAVAEVAPVQAPEVVEEEVVYEEPAEVVEEEVVYEEPAAEVVEEEVVYEEPATEVVEEEVVYEEPAAEVVEEEVVYEEPAAEVVEEEVYEEPAAEQAPAQQEPVQTQNQAAAPSNSGGQNWGALAACESGGDASIVSANGLYHGLYQFDVQTWQSVGGTGLPSQASAAEQTQRAQALYADRGAQPWPVCGARL